MNNKQSFYKELKRRFLKAQKETDLKEKAWLLENLSIELLYALAAEWLDNEEYLKEVKINKE